VDTSLPFFIPMPLLSPFGTMGAVIRMQGRIPSRAALMDIGAAGPLAGLLLAVPLYILGLHHSTLAPLDGTAGATLGESLGLRALEWLSGVQEPEGMSLELSPMAFAAWGGMFVTMINLIPAAQLDGGHVAYALFGKKQDGYARVVHRSMLAFFLVSVGSFVLRDVRAGIGLSHFGEHVSSSLFWLVWFEVLAVLGTLGRAVGSHAGAPRDEKGRAPLPIRPRAVGLVSLLVLAELGGDHDTPLVWIAFFAVLGLLLAMEIYSGAFHQTDLLDHPPPTDMAPLDPVRRVIAVVTLALFALLFMPTPISM
jgi:membrane-associated protease RseP (regulator of RpoE activity)